MEKNINNICITSVGPTVAELMSCSYSSRTEEPNDLLIGYVKEKIKPPHIDRAVIYNPDAVAYWLFEKYADKFTQAVECSDLALRLRSVMPSVTPVCFASMYTGVMPEIHGIQKYEKPVLKTETLFDAFVSAGKSVAIVSTEGDSISKIFLERNIDYYIYKTVSAVNAKALRLVKENRHDLIVIYNGNYDSRMHAKGPESKYALRALEQNLAYYCKLVSTIKNHMGDSNVLYGFCPDHGCHLIDGNRGSHGLDMEEDMNVIHLYGISEKR